ncbi:MULTISPECIES: hypothetical protein [Alicyclobacillus]|uniref:DUF1345 domain-containing protein n=1 Tax=Alicyclobacillus acidoterrestris (strain ATCC 49025 / DSM 3922 / CIP 106132 / NCIMB 13137 / GD3B) TaxID=1356854 RepID=T0BM97_ALIAG|nr:MULTISPECIES: hypothetical protein [Alicyclobacillus]EPZ41640.1 hypothetical protein N007_16760 [Alicyclobacillus acidoterrestris ATCC 49025]UNO50531.1 DUF1345 domain-containing protein [Alicyclobacillus acidoterrestris]
MGDRRQSSGLRIWPFIIVVLFVGVLYSAVSETVTIGPSWTTLAIIVGFLIPFSIAVVLKHHGWIRRIALILIFLLTVALISNVASLVLALFRHQPHAKVLFYDAVLLWVANVFVFALWYWSIDQGGAYRRYHHRLQPIDFLFPQMTTDEEVWHDWKPSFVDYLFVAFNTNTAFSPTDTLIMSRRVKVLVMTQAAVSLVIVAVLAARAISMV